MKIISVNHKENYHRINNIMIILSIPSNNTTKNIKDIVEEKKNGFILFEKI